MLFTIDKTKSLSILQMAMALFIILAPSLTGMLAADTGAYALFIFSALLFVMRLKKTEKMYLSAVHFIFLALLFYSVVSLLWVSNRSGHIMYLSALAAVSLFFSLVADYFSESSEEKVHRRMMYMFWVSGVICALVNIVYWLAYIVPFAGKDRFSQGIGNSDYLAVFMLLCIFLSCLLVKGNRRLRKNMLMLSVMLMAFVFVMAKSPLAWCFAVILGIVYILTKKSEKMFFWTSIVCTVIFTGIVICILAMTDYAKVFRDVFVFGIKNLFAAGGGFWSARELFLTVSYPEDIGVGLLPKICAASGLFGVICCCALMGRVVMQFVRLKTWESLICVLVTVMVYLIPFSDSYSVVFLWVGLIAYNEQAASLTVKRFFNKNALEKTLYTIAALVVLSAVLLGQSLVRASAASRYSSGDYAEAYTLYKAASSINPADAESCRNAVKALYKSGNIKENYAEAIALCEKAIARDRKDLDNLEIKAKTHYACGNYELCAQKYRAAAAKAVVKDKYNLYLVKALYKTVQQNPKGSSETKRAYEEILQIAQHTENLDRRKEINDIADKVLIYTKGELTGE